MVEAQNSKNYKKLLKVFPDSNNFNTKRRAAMQYVHGKNPKMFVDGPLTFNTPHGRAVFENGPRWKQYT